MIIWSRWGFFVFLSIGVGIATGFALSQVFAPGADSGSHVGAFIGLGLAAAGGYVAILDRLLIRKHLDKPQPIIIDAPLAQPWVDPQGRVVTHQRVPAVHPQTGQPLFRQPQSTFFFVPVRFWTPILVIGGLLLAVVNAILVGLA